MKKPKNFLITCCMITAFGIMLSITGFLLGGITGIGLTSDGIEIYTLSNSLKDGAENYNVENVQLENFSNINLNVSYSGIRIEESDHYGLDYRINKRHTLTYEVNSDTLTIHQGKNNDGRNSIQFFSIGINTNGLFGTDSEEYITIYVPSDSKLKELTLSNNFGLTVLSGLNADSITLKNDYGDVDIRKLSSGSLDLQIETGSLSMSDVAVGNISVYNAYGDMKLQQVSVDDDTLVTMESGTLRMKDMSAGSIQVNNSYGDVIGDKVSATSANLTLKSGGCQMKDFLFDTLNIDSSFGDVSLRTALPVSSYSLDLSTSFGDIYINNEDMGSEYKSNLSGASGKSIEIFCESGSIHIKNSK